MEDVSEVIVSVDGSVGVVGDVAEQLHADDRVDEEQHHHQHHHIWKSLQGGSGVDMTYKNTKSSHLYRLDKSVEENSYANRTSEQLDQSCRSEKSKESDFNNPGRVDDAPRHRDEVEPVPTVFEVRLQKRDIVKCCQTNEDKVVLVLILGYEPV